MFWYVENKNSDRVLNSGGVQFIDYSLKYLNFTDILSCAETGKGKDEPDIYLRALDCLETSADETCIFEDSHIAICTADKLGIKTVGIYDKYNYGQDEIKRISTVYIAEGETFLSQLLNYLIFNLVFNASCNTCEKFILFSSAIKFNHSGIVNVFFIDFELFLL